tara:strand:- start:60 stop:326 length:267 start_codon:yes stop_codon:yes gene_type:complete
MKVTRTSRYSATINTQDIDVTHEQLDAWRSGVSIQVAMPHLSPDEREFIMTGITSDEWKKLFPPEPAIVRCVNYPDGSKVFAANRRDS